MKKYLLLLCFTFVSFFANAHQPDLSSTMLVEQENGSWILQIRAALTAFEYEVNMHYGENAFPTAEKFQELVISHFKENISIHFNNETPVTFQNAYVKLGHETNIVFEVIGVPKTINTLLVKNSSFKNIYHNQSALIVLKKGFKKEQFILNNENKHTAKLKVAGNSFELLSADVDSVISTSSFPYPMIGFIFLAIGAIAFLWKIKTH